MQQTLFSYYKDVIINFFGEEFKDIISVEPPRDLNFGDFSTNAALMLSKKLSKPSMEIAMDLTASLCKNIDFADVSVKKPGFVNWKIPKHIISKYFKNLLDKDFGKSEFGKGKKVNVEYVSANPTGPLHAGHARGAVSGDVLANLLSFVGYSVTREYYTNDAGNQINIMAKSLYYRYRELYEDVGEIPTWAYPGEYLIDTAKKISHQHGDKFLSQTESEWLDFFKSFAINDMLECIKTDLKGLGIKHDVFSSELSLVKKGAVESAVYYLNQKGLIYRGVLNKPKGKEVDDWEEREQLLFKSTDFGDDVDRPLQKSDKTWTYFASDIAYHFDKISRGFDELIDVFGADHGGYVTRMKAAVKALSNNKIDFSIILVQLVKFLQNEKEVKMSKRAGTFVTVKDVLEKVNKDVIRFIMLTRKDDAPLDFDFQKVVKHSRDNPVFYVQYAYARTHSVLKQFKKIFQNQEIPDFSDINLESLYEDGYLDIIKLLLDWPRQVLMAAKNRQPHKIAFFLLDIAAAFHALWNQGKEDTVLRFILEDDFKKTYARVYLIKAVQNVMEIALNIIGVTPLKEL